MIGKDRNCTRLCPHSDSLAQIVSHLNGPAKIDGNTVQGGEIEIPQARNDNDVTRHLPETLARIGP